MSPQKSVRRLKIHAEKRLNTAFKFTEKLIRALSVVDNQWRILALSRYKKAIFLEPTPPYGYGGNVEHYYHFLFDLVLPLNFLIKKTPSDVIFVLKEFGPFTERLQHLFPGRIQVRARSEQPGNLPKICLSGMNPKGVQLMQGSIERFNHDVQNILGAQLTDKPHKILLIERLPPPTYFTTRAVKPGGGTLRRSILNHAELVSMLRSMVKPPFEFQNLQLEAMSLKEQIERFDQAAVVFAQHGAGLANCIWMKRQSTVVELNSDASRDHFQVISRLKRHSYYRYPTAGPHAVIDVVQFENWILRQAGLQSFFQQSARQSLTMSCEQFPINSPQSLTHDH